MWVFLRDFPGYLGWALGFDNSWAPVGRNNPRQDGTGRAESGTVHKAPAASISHRGGETYHFSFLFAPPALPSPFFTLFRSLSQAYKVWKAALSSCESPGKLLRTFLPSTCGDPPAAHSSSCPSPSSTFHLPQNRESLLPSTSWQAQSCPRVSMGRSIRCFRMSQASG